MSSLNFSEIAGTFLAGLGLFFFGVKTVSANFKQMAGRQMRLMASRWTSNSLLSGAAGALFAALTQSVTPITFVVMSLVTSGLVEARRAMPMIVWAGLGTSLMVLLSVLNVKLLVLYLIGVAGICFYFERPARAKHLVAALLGIGLLFYGLQLMRAGAANLESSALFKSMLQTARMFPLLLFAAAAAASVAVQSMAAVSIMAIAFAKAGLFEVDHAMVSIFGASFGSGIRVWVLSTGIKGTPRQMALLQMLVCGFGGLLCLALFYLERWTGMPLIKSVSTRFTGIEHQMASVYFFMNLVAGSAAALALPLLHRLLERWSPPSTEESLAKPQFIHPHALQDGETALILVRQEQHRLFQRLPSYFENLRNGQPSLELSSANRLLAAEVRHFITDLIDRHPSHDLCEQLLVELERARLFDSLDEGLEAFATTIPMDSSTPELKQLLFSLLEALDAILLTAIDALDPAKQDQLEWLLRITEDRSQMMENLRKTFLAGEIALSSGERSTLLHLTNLFERLVWLLRQFGNLLNRST